MMSGSNKRKEAVDTTKVCARKFADQPSVKRPRVDKGAGQPDLKRRRVDKPVADKTVTKRPHNAVKKDASRREPEEYARFKEAMKQQPYRSMYPGIHDYLATLLWNKKFKPRPCGRSILSKESGQLYGTRVSNCVDALVNGYETKQYTAEIMHAARGIIRVIERDLDTIVCSAQARIISDTHRFATNMDILGVHRKSGRIVIVEIKTTQRPMNADLAIYKEPYTNPETGTNTMTNRCIPNSEYHQTMMQLGLSCIIVSEKRYGLTKPPMGFLLRSYLCGSHKVWPVEPWALDRRMYSLVRNPMIPDKIPYMRPVHFDPEKPAHPGMFVCDTRKGMIVLGEIPASHKLQDGHRALCSRFSNAYLVVAVQLQKSLYHFIASNPKTPENKREFTQKKTEPIVKITVNRSRKHEKE